MTENIDINRIMTLLPHRYPFLLVDRVVSYEPRQNISAYKNVTFNEPFFQGHFPARPIMPGVLIVEAMAQTGGLLALLSMGEELDNMLLYFMTMDKVKFRRPVEPGDRLELRVDVLQAGSRAWKFRGEAFVDGRRVAEAEFTALPTPVV